MQASEEKIILGIETSCDDTSVCIMSGSPGAQTPDSELPKVLALNLFSQETLLKKWGGVVPEIAARNHLVKLAPLIEDAIEQADIDPSQIDAVESVAPSGRFTKRNV